MPHLFSSFLLEHPKWMHLFTYFLTHSMENDWKHATVPHENCHMNHQFSPHLFLHVQKNDITWGTPQNSIWHLITNKLCSLNCWQSCVLLKKNVPNWCVTVHHFLTYAFHFWCNAIWLAVLCVANPNLFHYFIWEHFWYTHLWCMPSFSRTQLGHKTHVWHCVKMSHHGYLGGKCKMLW